MKFPAGELEPTLGSFSRAFPKVLQANLFKDGDRAMIRLGLQFSTRRCEMSRRKSEAAAILGFFSNSPLEVAQFAFEQVRDVMKGRVPKKMRVQKAGKKAKGVGAAVPVPDAPSEE